MQDLVEIQEPPVMVQEKKAILELKVLCNSLVSLVTSFMDQRKGHV